ncbi:energy transducer TonB [Campylobacter mucosalis]|uniref:energy transducer TonB n=1 Tax=Campylobacter mucosalis TaxID=202 RepID=UPI0014702C06|nr:energy transducer TonB [Campylobacter mucosalis]
MVAQNRVGNIISFSISLFIHGIAFMAFFGFFTTLNKTLMAEKAVSEMAMSINLNQISTQNSNQNMQATQTQSQKDIKSDEAVTQIEQKKLDEPKPVIKPKKHNKPKPQKEQIKPLTQDIPKTTVVASSVAVAKNEAVAIGGTTQISNNNNDEKAAARNLIGEVYAAILKHKTYPKRAIATKTSGRTQVEFKAISKNEFEYINILKSSGYEYMDNHCKHILHHALKDFPDEAIGKNFKLAINFNLKDIQ